MGTPLRVVHFLNQFFAGIGGEDMANIPPRLQEGSVGSGRPLQQVLTDEGTIVATLICGDNYLSDAPDKAFAAIIAMLQELKPDVLIAGPAFESGRYGLACAAVCKAAQQIGIPALTGMHPDNPGVESGRPDILAVPTGASPVHMQAALTAMSRLAVKLGRKETLGPAEIEGFPAPGVTPNVQARSSGIPPRPRHAASQIAGAAVYHRSAHSRSRACRTGLAHRRPLEGYHCPRDHRRTGAQGQPGQAGLRQCDALLSPQCVRTRKSDGKDWEAYHAGYFNHIVNRNPNYILPLSFMRDLERKGEIGGIYPYIYALPGVSTPVAQSRRMGADVARELKEAEVTGCLLVAT